MSSTIERLPGECLACILKYTRIPTVLRFSRTSKTNYASVSEHIDEIVSDLFHQVFDTSIATRRKHQFLHPEEEEDEPVPHSKDTEDSCNLLPSLSKISSYIVEYQQRDNIPFFVRQIFPIPLLTLRPMVELLVEHKEKNLEFMLLDPHRIVEDPAEDMRQFWAVYQAVIPKLRDLEWKKEGKTLENKVEQRTKQLFLLIMTLFLGRYAAEHPEISRHHNHDGWETILLVHRSNDSTPLQRLLGALVASLEIILTRRKAHQRPRQFQTVLNPFLTAVPWDLGEDDEAQFITNLINGGQMGWAEFEEEEDEETEFAQPVGTQTAGAGANSITTVPKLQRTLYDFDLYTKALKEEYETRLVRLEKLLTFQLFPNGHIDFWESRYPMVRLTGAKAAEAAEFRKQLDYMESLLTVHAKTIFNNPSQLSGAYRGFYSYYHTLQRDPVVSLNLVVAHGEVQSNKIVISGEGSDNVGVFTIGGDAVKETGKVCFIKRYEDGLEWMYEGAMLPYGIAGLWSHPSEDIAGGTFLFWKH
ncbi:hypothetical protein BJ742DRAFT_799177 [Cladochytrium replicatum]|nr:hypothetical protein BJ742DRAFT_799177 [Cladochytrium replicatum]